MTKDQKLQWKTGRRRGISRIWVLGAGYWVLGTGCWVLGDVELNSPYRGPGGCILRFKVQDSRFKI
jgi:hypothetical protein